MNALKYAIALDTVIHADSPRAEGRIEKSFRTPENRLAKDMRPARVSSVEQANEFLIRYHHLYNMKFKGKPVSKADVHRPATSIRECDRFFCIREERTPRNDFTIAWNGKQYQIKDAVNTQKVGLEKRIDGSLHITHRGQDLRYREIKGRPVRFPFR